MRTRQLASIAVFVTYLIAACGPAAAAIPPPSAPSNFIAVSESASAPQISEARGVFASSGGLNKDVRSSTRAKGVLIRVPWADIEPSPGSYDFSTIDDQVTQLKTAGKDWSLGVLGGPSAPTWLYAGPYNILPLNIAFRDTATEVPQFWSTTLQTRLSTLAQALAQKYASDPDLRLIYVPQMTANGIEGHFNGNTNSSLTAQGFTEDLWVDAALHACKTFASAFPGKPIAIELHYILGSANAGKRIMQAIETDSSMSGQVGVAIWWLSGKTNYQTDLLTAFATFKGSIYAQLIDKADNASSFLNNDYSTAFTQAKSLNIKYVEPWDVDITSRKWDALFDDFNTYANQ